MLLAGCPFAKESENLPNESATEENTEQETQSIKQACVRTDFRTQTIAESSSWFSPRFQRPDRSYEPGNASHNGESAVLTVTGGSNVGAEINTKLAEFPYASYRAVLKSTNVPGTDTAAAR